jgi:quinol-cytochrome oxidoreductase complex cytochrome b subunit
MYVPWSSVTDAAAGNVMAAVAPLFLLAILDFVHASKVTSIINGGIVFSLLVLPLFVVNFASSLFYGFAV